MQTGKLKVFKVVPLLTMMNKINAITMGVIHA